MPSYCDSNERALSLNKFPKRISRKIFSFAVLIGLTACGIPDSAPDSLPTHTTHKPYESKLTTAPICPLADENGNYDMTALSEEEIVHIMQYGCRNEKPDGYRSQYEYTADTYEEFETDTTPSEQLSNEDLPAFDMFMAP